MERVCAFYFTSFMSMVVGGYMYTFKTSGYAPEIGDIWGPRGQAEKRFIRDNKPSDRHRWY